MIKSNLRDWTLDTIEESFGLLQVRSLPILDELLAHKHEADAYEQRYLGSLREDYLMLGGDDWNEVELENKLISPLIVFSGISNQKYSYFLERELGATINDIELSGRVDGMIASGFRNPKKPYFCLSEYKRGTDPNGDPKGQALIAMLVAQHLNHDANRNDDRPIFGSYIIGRNWCFMALVGKEYAISTDFSCVDDEIFDIFRIMKGLRVQIEKLI
ncbi:hypothetical protein LV89_02992 [Arcicella aurantiaca]|uniref:Uncharacterized protein n=1 Tax=Arcicella aurantiaca TaxID=591202 RepID=A0A316E534_9BACT|nr:hypothetical protein [Arcicella aurantiaca]PWK24479.1 hypothetical protein LV89_02992 [Arcicella aurantiaca]